MCGSGDRCSRHRWAALVLAFVLHAAFAVAHAQPGKVPEDESEIHLREGERLLLVRQYGAAARSLERALEINPRRGETYRRLGEAYYRLGRLAPALNALRTAYELEPTKRALAAELGAYLLEARQLDEALARLRFAFAPGVERPPSSGYDRALIALARYHSARGDARAALAALKALVARSPEPAYRLQLARLYLRIGLATRALELLERLPPGDGAVRLELAATLAVIDCARAAPLFGSIEARSWPDILLLRGRCALAAGNSTAALDLARQYLGAAEQAGHPADGYGLIGDAHSAAGRFAEARAAYLTASAQAPGQRLWAVRLAALSTLEGNPAGALEALHRLAAGASMANDEEWWLARGRAALALGRRAELAEAAHELAPHLVVALDEPDERELFGGRPAAMASDRVWSLLGELSLALGEHEAAELALVTALELHPSASTRRLWLRSLVSRAAGLLAQGEAAQAEQLLRRAGSAPTSVGPVAQVDAELAAAQARNLGVALLLQGRAKEAAAELARAVAFTPHAEAATTLMLEGRALAATGELGAARTRLAEAAELARPGERKLIALERAALELAQSPEVALGVLREVVSAPAEPAVSQRFDEALRQVQHAAAVAKLRAGDAEQAFTLLEELASPGAELAVRCNHALAAVAARRRSAAVVLRQLGSATCTFGGTSEGLAILSATLDGQGPGNATRALAELAAVAARAPAARALVAAATRVVAMSAAEHAYRRGQLALARRYLAQAHAARTAIGEDELAHNDAALALAEPSNPQRLQRLIAELERLESRVPEAAVSLGLAYDQAGRSREAVAVWQRARVRFAPVAEWLRAKQAWMEAP